jgi:hypothetical protein
MDDAEHRTPALTRFRRLILGRRSAESDTVISAFANAGRMNIAGLAPDPGPFDEPPAEPVILEGDIPWELREQDLLQPASTRSDVLLSVEA